MQLWLILWHRSLVLIVFEISSPSGSRKFFLVQNIDSPTWIPSHMTKGDASLLHIEVKFDYCVPCNTI